MISPAGLDLSVTCAMTRERRMTTELREDRMGAGEERGSAQTVGCTVRKMTCAFLMYVCMYVWVCVWSHRFKDPCAVYLSHHYLSCRFQKDLSLCSCQLGGE